MPEVTWERDGDREVGHTGGPRPAVIWIGVLDDETGAFDPNAWEIMAGGFHACGTETSVADAKRRSLIVAEAAGLSALPGIVFCLDPADAARAIAWRDGHDAKHSEDGCAGIGGRYTFSFCPTTIGTVIQVTCYCGDFIDLSDYDNW